MLGLEPGSCIENVLSYLAYSLWILISLTLAIRMHYFIEISMVFHLQTSVLIFFHLSGSPDDWECFQHYLGCLLEDERSLCNGPAEDKSPVSGNVEHQFSSLGDAEVHAKTSQFLIAT